MGEQGPLSSRPSCPCQICLIWRRLGEEVHLGHSCQSFKDIAPEHLREAFNKVLDAREDHCEDIWRSLAEGPQGDRGPRREASGGSRRAPEEGKKRKRKDRRSHSKEEARPKSKSDVLNLYELNLMKSKKIPLLFLIGSHEIKNITLCFLIGSHEIRNITLCFCLIESHEKQTKIFIFSMNRKKYTIFKKKHCIECREKHAVFFLIEYHEIKTKIPLKLLLKFTQSTNIPK